MGLYRIHTHTVVKVYLWHLLVTDHLCDVNEVLDKACKAPRQKPGTESNAGDGTEGNGRFWGGSKLGKEGEGGREMNICLHCEFFVSLFIHVHA